MIFSSLGFISVFLPVVFLLHCLIPGISGKNALLVMASLLFYTYGEPIFVVLMVCSAGFHYIVARALAAVSHKKTVLCLGIAVNLGLLAYFKYMAFLVESWNQLSGMELKVQTPGLPVGISFFTFQALSYVIDVYRGRIQVQKEFGKVLLYLAFFPQLIAGPIVKYRDISQALDTRKASLDQVFIGMRRFICGLGKKVLIANTMGQAADAVFCAPLGEVGLCAAWIGAVSYMLQIYYDFSGYSDMAIGMGNMFGFQFQENFHYPYGASSIKEFWRRWHISLSSWFKEYVYIPLGGNRKGKARTIWNKLIVFSLTGLWHGANWTFLLWGLYHGCFLVLEDMFPFIKKLPKAVTYLPTMLVVCVGFVMFRADTVSQGVRLVGQMFTYQSFESQDMAFAIRLLTPWFLAMASVGLFGMASARPFVLWAKGEGRREFWKSNPVQIALSIGSIGILIWCMARLSGSAYNPFIYFRF